MHGAHRDAPQIMIVKYLAMNVITSNNISLKTLKNQCQNMYYLK